LCVPLDQARQLHGVDSQGRADGVQDAYHLRPRGCRRPRPRHHPHRVPAQPRAPRCQARARHGGIARDASAARA
jgi:hypothetical protein